MFRTKALKPTLLTACLLTSLHLASALPALAAPPAELGKLNQALSPAWEQHLRQNLMREKFGVAITAKELGKNSYKLEIPERLLRDTVFDITLTYAGAQTQLKGRVYSAKEKELLTAAAKQAFGAGVQVQVETFPYAEIGLDYAITTQTASDLYVKPVAEAGDNLATQVRLGTPLEILEYSADKKFALVRIVDDGYIAWIQRNQILETAEAAFKAWKDNRQVLVMRNLESPRKLYFGTRLKMLSKTPTLVTAALPDGGQVKLAAADIALSQSPPQSPNIPAVLKTAMQYLPKAPQGGGAYLWGGTYGKTLDCSGFMQTIFRVNNVYLPRDADQQKDFTQRVGNTLNQLDELKPGDLVFFSGNRKYPTHVGMYIGQGRIIHSSPKGAYSGIKINTLQGGGDYDRYLQGLYFGGGRVTRSL